MRRAAAALAIGASGLLLTACGYQGTVQPTAAGVSGKPVKQTTTPALPKGDPASGKKLFASNGCTSCHTYGPAGSNAKIGPDLDKLPQYAKQANEGPLAQFVQTSITSPGSYVQPNYPNVMPTTYNKLPPKQIADLIAFLTQK
jgi:mono/diheme cytochrome c family protein